MEVNGGDEVVEVAEAIFVGLAEQGFTVGIGDNWAPAITVGTACTGTRVPVKIGAPLKNAATQCAEFILCAFALLFLVLPTMNMVRGGA